MKRKDIHHVYVAAPYSSDPEQRTSEAITYATNLITCGYTPFVPHLCHFWDKQWPHDYDFWMSYVTSWIKKCDAVARIPGHSPGADLECKIARVYGVPIFDAISFLMDNQPKEYTDGLQTDDN